MAGFTSPSILALSTWDAPERNYMSALLPRTLKAGYTAYHEPSVIAYAMPIVALAAGYEPSQMSVSDTHLYSAILGELLAGRDQSALDIRLDGEPLVDLSHSRLRQATEAIWGQYLARIAPFAKTYYWSQLSESMKAGSEGYIANLEAQIEHMVERIGGLDFRRESVWEHLVRVADDPHAIVVSNPPTYKNAYEKFFDTKDRLTWAAPEYEVFDAKHDIPRMVEFMEGRKALLVVQQQQTPGNAAHEHPVYARQLSGSELVYINSNRPDEVEAMMDGYKAVNRRLPAHAARRWPVLPDDYDVSPDSQIAVKLIDASTAEAYRAHWMHRISSAPGGANVIVLIDGYAAGVIGYSINTMTNSYAHSPWGRHLLLRFAFGAQHQSLRLTRLATMVSLLQSTAWLVASNKTSMQVAASKGLVTVEMTRHPEAKGLRGIMKIENRQSHPDGYKLTYAADWTVGESLESTLTTFLTGEARWLKARK